MSLFGYAGLNEDMNDFFQKSGFQSNSTGEGAYKGQTAGFYTGGSVQARTRVRNVYPAMFNMPSANAGCGGIDIYTGGFSFINSEELINTFKNVGNNALGYAFKLAMQTMSPSLEKATEDFRDMAHSVNQFNIKQW